MYKSLYSFALVALLLGVLWLSPVSGQERSATITGRATDVNHDPLVGAKVEVQPLGQTAVTDAQGQFTILGVAPGKYTVAVSYVGFTPFTKEVTVASGGTVKVDAELQIETVSEQVIVRGEREHGEIEALNREATADNIVQVLPAEVIISLPNTNIADALGRMPSVSLERDEGEGKYVQIRGTEPRLSNVTIDGVHVPSPEAVRNVKLDAIPADLIDSVEINKTLSANQEADAIGGSVNLVTKKATDQPYVTLLGMGGHTPTSGGRGLDQFTGTVGKRFGKAKDFGIMFGASYDWNGRGYNDVEPAPGITSVANGDFADGVPVFFGEDMREYHYDRTRFGFATSADYKVGTDSFLYLRGLVSQFNDFGTHWQYTPGVGNYTDATTSAPTSMGFRQVLHHPWQQIFNVTLGAQHTLGRNIIGYSVSGGHARFAPENAYPRAVFDGPGGIIFGLDTTNPHTPKFTVLNGVNIFDPATYTLSQFRTGTNGAPPTSERDITGDIWMSHSYNVGTRYGILETGFKVRDAQKTMLDKERRYNFIGEAAPTMSQFLGTFTDPGYYFGVYKYGPTTDWNKINAFFLANPALFSSDINWFHRNSDPNNFSASERVYAGYVMNTITLGHFRLQGGVRFEGTQGSFLGTQVSFDPDGNFISDTQVPGKQSYMDVLPSVQLQYNINGSTNIRAAYGRGIARPNFGDLPPYAIVDEGALAGTSHVTKGNPNLIPTHANNYDILFEHYLKSVGIIQFGWFYKALTDPIYTVSTVPTTGPFAGFFVDQPANGPSAHVQGVEMSWEQHLHSLPGLLGGIGVAANYSYTNSQANFPAAGTRKDHPALQRTAPNNWNFDVTYDKGPISARMGLTHNDAFLWAYNYAYTDAATYQDPILGIHGPTGDIYLYPHTQVDLQAIYHLPHAHDFQLVGSILNLNNEVFGFYLGSERYPIQREYYNRTYSLGLRWTPSFGKK